MNEKIKEELANKWEFTMNVIWSFLKSYSEWEPKVRFSKIEDSKINFQLGEGLIYDIKCFFVNNKYLQLEITVAEEPDFVASDRLILLNVRVALAKCEVVTPCSGTGTLKVSFAAIVVGATDTLARVRGIGLITACWLTTAISLSEQ